MTGREYIAKRVRRGGLGYLPLPLALLSVAILVYSSRTEGIAWFLAGLVVIAIAVTVGMLVSVCITCPFCSKWIGQILRFGASPFVGGLPRKIQFCPLCGADFDQELKPDETANHNSVGIRRPADGLPKPSR